MRRLILRDGQLWAEGDPSPLVCPYCFEDMGSPWCCGGRSVEAALHTAEALRAPEVRLPAGGDPC